MPVLTPALLIAALKTKLESVSGIGLVYDRRREVKDEPTARALWYHTGQGRINAWSVTLGEPPATNARHPGFGALGSGQAGTILTDFGIVIEGVFGMDDAASSEVTFRDLCWSICLAFNLDGLARAEIVHQDALQWERFGYLVLAGQYHVHYARFMGRYTGKSA